MKLTAKELEIITCNSEFNDFMRMNIGAGLCKSLYDSANSEEDYPGKYAELYNACFYNSPSDDDIFLCLDYIEEILQYDLNDYELEIDLQ